MRPTTNQRVKTFACYLSSLLLFTSIFTTSAFANCSNSVGTCTMGNAAAYGTTLMGMTMCYPPSTISLLIDSSGNASGTPLTGGTSSRNTSNCTTYRSAPSNIRIIAANPGDDCNSVDYTSGTSSITLPTQATMYCVDTGATFPSGSTAKGLLTLSGNTFVSGVFQSSSGTPLIVPTPPTAPSGFTATVVSANQIDLSWTDNSSDETGFKIEQPAGTLVTTTAANATSYSHTGLTCGTTYNYTLKATNANGDSSSVTASATTNACAVQTITGFTPANSATYGDSPIILSATGGASGNTVSFASTTASVCSVTGSTLNIIGVGTCTVTADQAGNASYSAASQVSQDITVAKKSITAQVDNKTRVLGAANPSFTISYTGLVNGDSSSAISTPPTASTTATVASALGSYPITCDNSSSSATNYIISTCADGNLIVSKATPSMTLTSAAPVSGLGTAITVNFTVTGTPTPTGTVTVSDGTVSCTAPVAVGTCSFTPTTSGIKTLTATYAGDSNYATTTQTSNVTITQVILSNTNVNVTEGGATGSYTIKLASQPANNVVIGLTPNSQVTVSPTTLTFTTANWNTPQTVTVTAVDYNYYHGSRTVLITQAITTGDGAGYPNSLSISKVSTNITDNQSPPVYYANLSVNTTGTGKGIVGGSATGIYVQGTNITLTATPDASSTFVAWTPASCATTFAMNADTVCSAQFDLKPIVTPPPVVTPPVVTPPAPVNYNLSLNSTGTGKGTITGTTAGSYVAGTSIQLTATPDASSTFVTWTPASCANAFALNIDTVCSAQFDLKPVIITPPPVVVTPVNYKLSLNTTGTGKGTLTGTAAGSYVQGTNVSLTTTVDASSIFVAWTPASCATAFALNADTVCSAQFDLKPVVITPPVASAEVNPCIRNLSLSTATCSGAGEKTTITEVGSEGQLSNTIIDAPLTSKGWVSNTTVTAKGRIMGGTITGYLENAGIISDIEFKGRYIKGGFLSGKIINSSTVGGYLENVTFTANASLIGGILQGNIKGNPNAPALLENVTIKQGSVLWGIALGKGVILEPGVTIKDNISLPVLEKPLAIDATGNSTSINTVFYGGISVSNKPFVRKTVQLLAEPVVIRGRVIAEPEHVGKKVDLFVYSPYWSSTASLDSKPLGYYIADDKANILVWDQKLPTLVAFKKGVYLDSVQEVDMFIGNFIATGGLSIVFGYRLEDGTVIMNTVPNTIDVTIQ